MKTKKVIELSKEDLKNILCEYFNLQRPKAILTISITKGDRPGESDCTEIRIESE